jgi:predicted Rossmann fold flavoprotein
MPLPPDWDVIVVGAGAAGLFAATRAAECGRRTLLLEKNVRPGTKILMSGGTRCNITQNTDSRGIVDAFGPSGRFLYSALARLNPQEVVALFEAEGVPSKIEPTGKIFPVSDRASDVLDALVRRLNRSGCTLALEQPLVDLVRLDDDSFQLITPDQSLHAAKVIVTTGGQSYPGSGTTGDGYQWATKLGHTVIPPRPALTPVTVDAMWVRELQGVTLTDVAVRVIEPPDTESPERQGKQKCLAQRRGSFLFTHFGLSGPVILDVSRVISGHAQPRRLKLECDFLPATSGPELDAHLRNEAATSGKKQLGGVLSHLLPRRLTDTLLALLTLPQDRKLAELSKADRGRLVQSVKGLAIPVTGTRGFKKAEVTAGGISLQEVDSHTMQSRLIPNLFLAGEVLDLDGPIGGYNFQAAFSTGWLAGECV